MSIAALGGSTTDTAALRAQFQQNLFNRLSGGTGSISFAQFQAAQQNLPGAGLRTPANPAASGNATPAAASGNAAPAASSGNAASVLQSAFQAIDTDKDGKITAGEFSASLNQRAGGLHRHHRHAGKAQGAGAPPQGTLSDAAAALASQLFGGDTAGTQGTAQAGQATDAALFQEQLRRFARFAAAPAGPSTLGLAVTA